MKKALVCYVRPDDETADIAMTVAQQLCRLGLHVELRPIARVRSPQCYRTVVLGGASSSERWDSRALSYLADCLTDGQHSVWPFHTAFGSTPPLTLRRTGGPDGGPTVPAPVRHLARLLGAGPVPIFRAVGDGDPAISRWGTRIGEDVAMRRFLDRSDPSGGAALVGAGGAS